MRRIIFIHQYLRIRFVNTFRSRFSVLCSLFLETVKDLEMLWNHHNFDKKKLSRSRRKVGWLRRPSIDQKVRSEIWFHAATLSHSASASFIVEAQTVTYILQIHEVIYNSLPSCPLGLNQLPQSCLLFNLNTFCFSRPCSICQKKM